MGVSGVNIYSLYEFGAVKRWRIFRQNWNILISSILIEFWCFGLPAALGRGRWVGMGCLEAYGGYPYTCAHACACTRAHVYMYRNCKWPRTWRHPCLSCLTCMCVDGAPLPTQSTHPSPIQRGDPRNQLKFKNTWTNQDNSILFEDLKFVENPSPMSGCIVWLVGLGQIHKTPINVDPIKIIQFCLKIYDL